VASHYRYAPPATWARGAAPGAAGHMPPVDRTYFILCMQDVQPALSTPAGLGGGEAEEAGVYPGRAGRIVLQLAGDTRLLPLFEVLVIDGECCTTASGHAAGLFKGAPTFCSCFLFDLRRLLPSYS
jgi:hypothetical protein